MLPQSVFPILDRRLRSASPAPLAVGLSGGGDSLALLLVTRAWAQAHGRRIIALTVDHGLNPDSAGWTRFCSETAERLDVGFRALRWTGDKPATGLPAAARAARHALLADAAREAGAKVLLLGHTADDLTESAAMRAEGSTVPDAREWSPSPAWPEGRDVFLLRPLLAVGRAALRDYLREIGETWIDDPANENVRFARARARTALSSPRRGEGDPAEQGGGGSAGDDGSILNSGPSGKPHAAPSTTLCVVPLPTMWGGLVLARSATPSTVAMAALCAAGTARPPRGDSLAQLARRLRDGEPFVITLAGARIEADGGGITVMRDAGEIRRDGLAPLPLSPGESVVWDGRFEITTDRADMAVRPLAGLATKLPAAQRTRLKAIPAAARPTLPVLVRHDGAASCPILAEPPPVRVRALAVTRFEAATGCVDSEPAP
ncbi:MAG: tRNA lysidine(34) synthetase TilS [Caulobacterales bacterium]|nr:tRNA lysidine(34) synthetase TilS [Caulobacterales bacterium]